MRGKIIQEDGISCISFWPSILVFVNHCQNTDTAIFGANYFLISSPTDLGAVIENIELHMGCKLRIQTIAKNCP
jgi:hypothetical protein